MNTTVSPNISHPLGRRLQNVVLLQLARDIQASGRGGGEGPEHEGDHEPSACACANACEAPQEDRSAGAHADGAHRDDEHARVPKPHVNARVRGAQSYASTPQKS